MFSYVIERFVSDFAQLNCGHFANTAENWTVCEVCHAEADQREQGREEAADYGEIRPFI